MENRSNKRAGLKIVREFEAPKTLVFDAFSTAGAFAQWWGQPGMPVTVALFDFRQGGKVHYNMQGNGQIMWGVLHYKNMLRPDLIEFVSSFSDEEGNICKSPFPIDFPLEIFNQVTLDENNGITTLTLSGHPINATAEQEATYYAMIDNMNQGFGVTMDQLEAYLIKQLEQ
ncbi:SRPBCC domain-containing protein [Flagellimonas alvinocaridis]|uniref:SRPBCC domain-containing protein n=1 Tax=Flagellimonas alvinocaridis TaxID=2530200 RepID=A0A4S8RSP4_9FLAO|nr:SRPBCC domain-containing protein [Allomuricauda alvinocaridis]THV58159.1 SRPBCC domain-containing protein [Allomuricauda alvinocaridis]